MLSRKSSTLFFYQILTEAIQGASKKYIDTIKLLLTIPISPKTDLVFNGESNWYLAPSASRTPPVILALTGAVLVEANGSTIAPPFSPLYSPPDTVLNSPGSAAVFYLTEYFFSTFFWAVGRVGVFNHVITNAMIPAASPIKLTTNDKFFLAAVPALSGYPNAQIAIDTTAYQYAEAKIDVRGIHVYGNVMRMDFYVVNGSVSFIGWSLLLRVDFEVKLDITTQGAKPESVVIQPVPFDANFTTTLLPSKFSNVSTDYFDALFQLLEGLISIPPYTITLPVGYTVSNTKETYVNNYVQINLDYTTYIGHVSAVNQLRANISPVMHNM